jgi:hypothetical protein
MILLSAAAAAEHGTLLISKPPLLSLWLSHDNQSWCRVMRETYPQTLAHRLPH